MIHHSTSGILRTPSLATQQFLYPQLRQPAQISHEYGVISFLRDRRNLQSNNPWYLDRLEGAITAIFQEGDSPEIEINYEIFYDKSDHVNVSLLETDCSTRVDGADDGALRVAFQGVNGTAVPSEPDLVVYQVLLDVNEQNIYNSTLWTAPSGGDSTNFEGTIDFCIRIELVEESTGESVSFSETRVALQVALIQDFTILDVNANPVSNDSETISAQINYEIDACQCDAQNSCYVPARPVAPNSVLRLCIKSLSTEVEVETVTRMELKQDVDNDPSTDPVLMRTPVSNGTPDILTTLLTTTNNVAVVETHVTSSFFSSDNTAGSSIYASGTARLLLSNGDGTTRRLNIFSRETSLPFQVIIPIQSMESHYKSEIRVVRAFILSAFVAVGVLFGILLYKRRRRHPSSIEIHTQVIPIFTMQIVPFVNMGVHKDVSNEEHTISLSRRRQSSSFCSIPTHDDEWQHTIC